MRVFSQINKCQKNKAKQQNKTKKQKTDKTKTGAPLLGLAKFIYYLACIVQSVSVEIYENRDKLRKSTKFGIHVLEGT